MRLPGKEEILNYIVSDSDVQKKVAQPFDEEGFDMSGESFLDPKELSGKYYDNFNNSEVSVLEYPGSGGTRYEVSWEDGAGDIMESDEIIKLIEKGTWKQANKKEIRAQFFEELYYDPDLGEQALLMESDQSRGYGAQEDRMFELKWSGGVTDTLTGRELQQKIDSGELVPESVYNQELQQSENEHTVYRNASVKKKALDYRMQVADAIDDLEGNLRELGRLADNLKHDEVIEDMGDSKTLSDFVLKTLTNLNKKADEIKKELRGHNLVF